MTYLHIIFLSSKPARVFLLAFPRPGAGAKEPSSAAARTRGPRGRQEAGTAGWRLHPLTRRVASPEAPRPDLGARGSERLAATESESAVLAHHVRVGEQTSTWKILAETQTIRDT